jgi:hypothetical protein
MDVTGERIMHGFEPEFGSLAESFPDMLLMGEMICKALTHKSHPAKSCWVC